MESSLAFRGRSAMIRAYICLLSLASARAQTIAEPANMPTAATSAKCLPDTFPHCPDNHDPVCAGGVTYLNDCYAEAMCNRHYDWARGECKTASDAPARQIEPSTVQRSLQPCADIRSNCLKQMSKGKCTNILIRAYCMETCGFCGPAPTAEPTLAPTTTPTAAPSVQEAPCVDYLLMCPLRLLKGKCKDPRTLARCPKSCSLCDAPNTGISAGTDIDHQACTDLLRTSRCEVRKRKGKCSKAATICKKTCGVCNA